jgi:hypothetical protein
VSAANELVGDYNAAEPAGVNYQPRSEPIACTTKKAPGCGSVTAASRAPTPPAVIFEKLSKPSVKLAEATNVKLAEATNVKLAEATNEAIKQDLMVIDEPYQELEYD